MTREEALIKELKHTKKMLNATIEHKNRQIERLKQVQQQVVDMVNNIRGVSNEK